MSSPAAGFDFQARTRVVFGAGTADRVGELARDLGCRRALVVTDAGIVAAGHLDRVRRSLEAAGLAVAVFDRARENPTARDVEDCAAVAREARPDLFVGLGGGSSMDTAKGANFLLSNGGRMQDYWGHGKAAKPFLPLIAIPTTAGTGSELQSYALVTDESSHQKMACGDPKAAARIALLDPTLTLSQPRRVSACTGLDAVTHAVETAVTRRRNELSWLYSRESFRLTVRNLETVLQRPDDLDARAGMQLGAAYAGLAIELSMLGAAHSAANPLTARFGLIHGQAVSMMLPHVVRFNGREPGVCAAYGELLAAAGVPLEGRPADLALASLLEKLLAAAEMPPTIADCGVTADALPGLAAEAAKQWTAQFNPRAVTAEDFQALYRSALSKNGGTSS